MKSQSGVVSLLNIICRFPGNEIIQLLLEKCNGLIIWRSGDVNYLVQIVNMVLQELTFINDVTVTLIINL